jgi:predicted nucleic acid-binding protein
VSALPLDVPLPDPDDRAFVEVAIAADADWLVTGNVKHFPSAIRKKVRVIEPTEFVQLLEE